MRGRAREVDQLAYSEKFCEIKIWLNLAWWYSGKFLSDLFCALRHFSLTVHYGHMYRERHLEVLRPSVTCCHGSAALDDGFAAA